jgi:hypothetical protein
MNKEKEFQNDTEKFQTLFTQDKTYEPEFFLDNVR